MGTGVKTVNSRAKRKKRTGSAGRNHTGSARRRPRASKTARTGKGILTQSGSQNSLSLFLAFFAATIILVAVGFNAFSLNRRLRENRSQVQQLQQEIRTEEQRAADIEEYRRYTGTDAYIEEVAREKLGLIYEGETVFKEKK